MSKRDTYINTLSLQIDELNATMRVLDAKLKTLQAEAREQYQAELLKLHQQSLQASDRLKALRDAGEESWDELVAETEKVRDAFINSFHYFKSQL